MSDQTVPRDDLTRRVEIKGLPIVVIAQGDEWLVIHTQDGSLISDTDGPWPEIVTNESKQILSPIMGEFKARPTQIVRCYPSGWQIVGPERTVVYHPSLAEAGWISPAELDMRLHKMREAGDVSDAALAELQENVMKINYVAERKAVAIWEHREQAQAALNARAKADNCDTYQVVSVCFIRGGYNYNAAPKPLTESERLEVFRARFPTGVET